MLLLKVNVEHASGRGVPFKASVARTRERCATQNERRRYASAAVQNAQNGSKRLKIGDYHLNFNACMGFPKDFDRKNTAALADSVVHMSIYCPYLESGPAICHINT